MKFKILMNSCCWHHDFNKTKKYLGSRVPQGWPNAVARPAKWRDTGTITKRRGTKANKFFCWSELTFYWCWNWAN